MRKNNQSIVIDKNGVYMLNFFYVAIICLIFYRDVEALSVASDETTAIWGNIIYQTEIAPPFYNVEVVLNRNKSGIESMIVKYGGNNIIFGGDFFSELITFSSIPEVIYSASDLRNDGALEEFQIFMSYGYGVPKFFKYYSCNRLTLMEEYHPDHFKISFDVNGQKSIKWFDAEEYINDLIEKNPLAAEGKYFKDYKPSQDELKEFCECYRKQDAENCVTRNIK